MKKLFGRVQRKRSVSGFTMVEMLIAVAIIIVLMAVAFVGVINHRRSLKRLELNDTAREIYFAAQNHLSMAKSQGLLEDVDPNNPEMTGEKQGDSHYWYVMPRDSRFASRDNLLYEMLPFGSIDDTVRLGGSYVIKYDLETATVIKVGYSDQTELSSYRNWSTSRGEWDDAEPETLDNQLIGWYTGAEIKSRTPAKLPIPSLNVVNAERLEVTVDFADSVRAEFAGDASLLASTYVQIIMRGKTSKSEKVVNVWPLSEFLYGSQTAILDDITKSGEHFAEKWCDASDGKPLIPGEDITLCAKVYNNATIASIAKSSTKQTNSLFAQMIYAKPEEGSGDSQGERVLTVANIRHLENLGASISGYDPEELGDDGATSARQVADLQWASTGAKKSKAFLDRVGDGEPDKVQIYYLDDSEDPTIAATFAPVNPEFGLTYEGKGKKISNVKVEVEGSAGIFGEVQEDSSISNLAIVNANVTSTDNAAGALVGKSEGVLTLQNVIVRNSSGSASSKITGAGSTGGLVGSFNGGGSIEECAAAVRVESKGDGASAGGLVGDMQAGSVERCYAGGHTKNGLYDKDSINVVAAGTSGGLIGRAQNTEITSSYATTSASGGTAGGLLGEVKGGNVASCYATGLVVGSARAGALVGNNDAVTYKHCRYLEIINDGMKPIDGEDSLSDLYAADADVVSFAEFFYKDAKTANPYDEFLTNHYKDFDKKDGTLYPYPTVAQLAEDDTVGGFVKTHYGDWPSPETFVINTPNGN